MVLIDNVKYVLYLCLHWCMNWWQPTSKQIINVIVIVWKRLTLWKKIFLISLTVEAFILLRSFLWVQKMAFYSLIDKFFQYILLNYCLKNRQKLQNLYLSCTWPSFVTFVDSASRCGATFPSIPITDIKEKRVCI